MEMLMIKIWSLFFGKQNSFGESYLRKSAPIVCYFIYFYPGCPQFPYEKQCHWLWVIARLLSYLKYNHAFLYPRTSQACCSSLLIKSNTLLSKAPNLHDKSYGHSTNKEPKWVISAGYKLILASEHAGSMDDCIDQMCKWWQRNKSISWSCFPN